MATVTSEGILWADDEVDLVYEKNIANSLKLRNSQISPSVSQATRQFIRLSNQALAEEDQASKGVTKNTFLPKLIEATLLFEQNKLIDANYGEGVILEKIEIKHQPNIDYWEQSNTIAYKVVVRFLDGKTHTKTIHVYRYLD